MPTRTWTGATNNNWGTSTNWSEGAVPTNLDDVVFGTNVNCSITSGAVCKTITFGTYSGTFSNSGGLTVSGNVSLGSSVVWGTWSSYLAVDATATLTSNTKDIPYLRFHNTITITLADNWTVTANLFYQQAAITVTVNSNIIYVSGGTITHSNGCTMAGTTAIHITGTVNWTAGSATFSNPITINTAGTFTLSNTFTPNNTTITWIAGNMTVTGSTTVLNNSVTFTGTGLTFNNVSAFTGTVTLTLSNNITILGTLSGINACATFTINGFILYIGAGLATVVNTTVTGTTSFVLNGTGTISTASASGNFRNNITINTSGTITISGTFRWSTGTFTYTAGTVVTTGSTLSMTSFSGAGTTTLATSGMTWNNITIGGLTTHTWNASSTVYLSGTFTFLGGGGVLQGMWETSGSLTHTGGTTYTNVAGATVTMTGTGNLSTTAGGSLTCNLTINTSGTITISNATTFRYHTGTFTYTAGTVVTTGTTMSIAANVTLATNGITWNNITTTTGLTTLTLTNKLTVSGELWFQGDTTISGDVFETYGLNIGLITVSNSIDLVLVASKEYIVTGYIKHYGARQGTVGTISSASPGTKTILTVRQGSTQNIGYVNVTDVNSLNGITLRSYSGSFSNTDNWIKLNQEYTIGNGS